MGAVVAFGLGCSSLQPRSSNRLACEKYVEHVNGLESCLGVRYDASNLCEQVDETDVDMAGWYECLLANSACEGDRPKLDVDGCEPPVIDLAKVATNPG